MAYEPASTTQNKASQFLFGGVVRRLVLRCNRVRCWWRGQHREVELERGHVEEIRFTNGSSIRAIGAKTNSIVGICTCPQPNGMHMWDCRIYRDFPIHRQVFKRNKVRCIECGYETP